MAVVAQSATRQEKEKWLTRPLDWAGHCGMYGSIFAGLGWFNGDIDLSIVAGIALGTILVMIGLLMWGIRRVHNAARGRY